MLVSARNRTALCRGPWKTPGGWGRDQHLTITEVFFGGSAIRDVRLALQQEPKAMSPACNIPSGNPFHQEALRPGAEKFLTFVNPVFPGRAEYVKRLPAWRFARGANRK